MRKDYVFKIGEIVEVNTGSIKILETIRMERMNYEKITTEKGYKYICLKCGNEDKISESNLKKKNGCTVCSHDRVVEGINDITTTHPHLVKYFKDKNFTCKNSYAVNKKTMLICPECGYEKEMTPNHLNYYGFNCDLCGDGMSFPNKFILSMLQYINVNFEKEKKFTWSNNITHDNPKLSGYKKYDFYIPSKNLIIEAHGEQHYFNRGRFKYRTLQEERENDKIKKELALANGIKYYIELNCSTSTVKYITNSIFQSELNSILDLKNIEWDSIIKLSKDSQLIKVINMWESGIKSTTVICNKLNISLQTCLRYLRKGNELNLCTISSEILKENRKNTLYRRKVICLENNKIYESIKQTGNKNNVSATAIRDCCIGKNNKSKGLHFLFLDDYNYLFENKFNLSDYNAIKLYLKNKYSKDKGELR